MKSPCLVLGERFSSFQAVIRRSLNLEVLCSLWGLPVSSLLTVFPFSPPGPRYRLHLSRGLQQNTILSYLDPSSSSLGVWLKPFFELPALQKLRALCGFCLHEFHFFLEVSFVLLQAYINHSSSSGTSEQFIIHFPFPSSTFLKNEKKKWRRNFRHLQYPFSPLQTYFCLHHNSFIGLCNR